MGGKPLAERRGGVLYFLQGDQLGSVSLTTDVSGNPVFQARYSAFGGTRAAAVGTPVADDEALAFTGQMADRADGWIYFYGARIYDNNINRFISADTIVPNPSNPQSLNRYSYALNNPIRYNDPTGHCPACLALGPEVVGIGIGVVVLSAALVVGNEMVVNHVSMGQAVQDGMDNAGTNTRREIGWLAAQVDGAGGTKANSNSTSGAAAGGPNDPDRPSRRDRADLLRAKDRPTYTRENGVKATDGTDPRSRALTDPFKNVQGGEFTNGESANLKQFFDTGNRPDNLSTDTLLRYGATARDTILEGIDNTGTQYGRLQMLLEQDDVLQALQQLNQ